MRNKRKYAIVVDDSIFYIRLSHRLKILRIAFERQISVNSVEGISFRRRVFSFKVMCVLKPDFSVFNFIAAINVLVLKKVPNYGCFSINDEKGNRYCRYKITKSCRSEIA